MSQSDVMHEERCSHFIGWGIQFTRWYEWIAHVQIKNIYCPPPKKKKKKKKSMICTGACAISTILHIVQQWLRENIYQILDLLALPLTWTSLIMSRLQHFVFHFLWDVFSFSLFETRHKLMVVQVIFLLQVHNMTAAHVRRQSIPWTTAALLLIRQLAIHSGGIEIKIHIKDNQSPGRRCCFWLKSDFWLNWEI